jgi:hypothetical protein
MNIEPTPKEKKLVSRIYQLKLTLAAVIMILVSFVFAKIVTPPSYNPIIITDVSRVLNTSYQATLQPRWNIVNFSVSINSSLTLSGGQTGTILLQTSPDNSTWTTVSTAVNGNTGTLTVGLATTNSQTVQMVGTVPPNYYYRLSSSGASTMGITNGREVAF